MPRTSIKISNSLGMQPRMTMFSTSQGLKGRTTRHQRQLPKCSQKKRRVEWDSHGMRCGNGSRKRRHLRIECANKRPSHIDGKRPLNSVASVIATNRKWGETADRTDTRVDICLINGWKIRINRERLYIVRAYAPKKVGSMVPRK